MQNDSTMFVKGAYIWILIYMFPITHAMFLIKRNNDAILFNLSLFLSKKVTGIFNSSLVGWL